MYKNSQKDVNKNNPEYFFGVNNNLVSEFLLKLQHQQKRIKTVHVLFEDTGVVKSL